MYYIQSLDGFLYSGDQFGPLLFGKIENVLNHESHGFWKLKPSIIMLLQYL